MAKKFITKLIDGPEQKNNASKEKDDKTENEKKFNDFYGNGSDDLLVKPDSRLGHWLITILLAVLFGFAAGFIYNYFLPSRFPQEFGGNDNIYIDKQENITVTALERLAEINALLNPVIVNFYDTSEKSGQFYQDTYSYGTGLIVTSDGWILTTAEVIAKINSRPYAVLTPDYKQYQPERILRDPATPAVFVKIKADNLPAAKFGSLERSFSGELVYGFIASYPAARLASLHLADLSSPDMEDVVESSERYSHFLSCREGYDPSLLGSPLVNQSGEVLAIVIDQRHALPIDYLSPFFSSLGKKEVIVRPELGVHYISLAQYPRFVASGGMNSRGALLSGFKNMTAVVKGSPADESGLRVGDIILLVEDELVNNRKNLAAIIQEYQPGSEIKLTISRNNQEKLIKVKLGVRN